MPLVDVGGGNKLYEISPSELMDQAKGMLSLRDLQNKIRQAPFDLQKAQSEAAISANNADPNNLQMQNVLHTAQAMEAAHKVDPSVQAVQDALAQAELQSRVGAETRAKSDFVLKGMSSLPAVFGQDFNLGKQFLKTVMPNAVASQKPDGTFSIGVPQPNGEISVVNMDPNRVGDPDKRKALEEQLRTGWGKVGEGFATVDEFYKNLQKTSPLASGPGDIATIFSYMKMLDRHNAVREGQFDAAQALAAGIPQRIINLYQRAVETGGPVLGAADSATRKGFQTAADAIYDNAKQDAVLQGQFFATTAKNAGADPRNVIQPYGGLTLNSLFPGQTKEITSATPAVGNPLAAAGAASGAPAGLPAPGTANPPTSEASVVPGGSTDPAPQAAPTAPPARVEDTLKNLFSLPAGGQ